MLLFSGKKFKFGTFETPKSVNPSLKESEVISENIKKLELLSKESKQTTAQSTQAFREHTEKLQRVYTPKSRLMDNKFMPRKRVTAEGTVFTEEDFEKFSQEHFIHSMPIHSSTLTKKKPKFEDF